MPAVSGFYRCPACGKAHTLSGGFVVVECSCGVLINQFDVISQGSGENHTYYPVEN